MTLYGFLHSQDWDMFRQLLGVNGIGPKGALGILSVLSPDDLRLAIVSEDVKALAKAPGIGNKTAQRLILDLKDKISMDDVLGTWPSGPTWVTADTGASMAGLVEAPKEAVRHWWPLAIPTQRPPGAVKQVEVADGMTSEDVLKASLKAFVLPVGASGRVLPRGIRGAKQQFKTRQAGTD